METCYNYMMNGDNDFIEERCRKQKKVQSPEHIHIKPHINCELHYCCYHSNVMFVHRIIAGLFLIKIASCGVLNNSVDDCQLSDDLLKEISSYSAAVKSIIERATAGDFENVTYNELATFIDKFGNRKLATQNLENAIDYMVQRSKDYGLNRTRTEEIDAPNWVRGEESAMMVEPRNLSLSILGLGFSVGTPADGILAEVLVVRSFDDLAAKGDQANGKIVVYNQDYVSYGVTVAYRSRGASEAAKYGALAALVRSVTPFSMNTPHTGMQSYQDNVTQIPVASITVEDAHMLQRIQDRNETIKILLKMGAKMLPNTTSRNTIIELEGSEKPEQIVIVSGHIDSWDVGCGAMDDGAGFMISWAALALLKQLGLQPKRTIRAILWTGEEFGYIGAKAYYTAHLNESDNYIFLMESDIGTFNPVGISYTAGEQGGCILEEIMKLLEPINATQARYDDDVGSDITLWTGSGWPGAQLDTENDKYFWFHHSAGDTMDVEDPIALNKNTALWAAVAYVIADLSVDFPREALTNKTST